MRKFILALSLLLASVTSYAYVSVHIGVPVAIGINVPVYPAFVRVPGYPVYYAPRVHANYFFYDGLYWVYRRGNWYTSYWYNGPWGLIEPDEVPLFVLRVPVRYYYERPAIFETWYLDGPPNWVEIWGSGWGDRHSGWDRWNRSAVPTAAPLPVYQRQYSGNRYPGVNQQSAMQSRNYRYQPRDPIVRQIYQARGAQPATAPLARAGRPAMAAVTPRAMQVQQQRVAQQQQRVVAQRAMRQAQPRIAQQREFRTQQLREARVAPQRQFQAMRQPPVHLAMRQAPAPREMQFHEARGGPGPGGGAHGGGGGPQGGGGGPHGGGGGPHGGGGGDKHGKG